MLVLVFSGRLLENLAYEVIGVMRIRFLYPMNSEVNNELPNVAFPSIMERSHRKRENQCNLVEETR